MKTLPSYSRIESDFDLDEEIDLAVKETKKFIKEVNETTDNDVQAKAILKACLSEFVEVL